MKRTHTLVGHRLASLFIAAGLAFGAGSALATEQADQRHEARDTR